MIWDLRYHLASLVGVFLALGLGILIGLSLSDDGALSEEQAAMIASIETQLGLLRAQREQLSADLGEARRKIEALERFGEAVMPYLVAGRLSGARAALVIAGRAAPPDEVAARVADALREAGGEVVATLFLGSPDPGRGVAGEVEALAAQLLGAAALPPQPSGGWWELERDSEAAPEWVIFVNNLPAGRSGARESAQRLFQALAARSEVELVAAAAAGSGVAAGPPLPALHAALLGPAHLAIDAVDTPVGLVALIQGMAQRLRGRYGASPGRILLPPLDVGSAR
ncbi:MAG TPA: copper transporter [Limnochordia bacterium]